MEPNETNSNQNNPSSSKTPARQVGIGIAVVALLALVAVVFGNNKSTTTTADTTTPSATDTGTPTTSAPQETTNPAATTPTPSTTPTTSASTYKDGTYTATGSYQSPGGPDHLGVTLTIKNDIVTDASIKAEPGDRESAYYQNIFIQNCRPLVVGKDITTLKLSKVSGSSLTSGGFNDAVAQIKAEAKA